MQPLIVNIHAHNPPYAFASDHDRPDVAWEKPDGTWLGLWARDWPDLLGEAILRADSGFRWEVWQPDYRADRVCSATLESGETHRLFPATERTYYPGLRAEVGIYSEPILSSLAAIGSEPTILHLHGFRVPFYSEILAECGRQKRFPIFIVGHGMSTVPTSEMAGLHRPLTYACLLVEHWKLSRLLSHVDVISAQSEYARSELRKIFRGRAELLTMGCDFDFWVPVPTAEQKRVVRSALGIPQTRTVFLATGNFVPLKQFDKLLDVFGRLGERQDYVLLIAGHGDQANTERLEVLSRSLVGRRKTILHPYVTGEQLRNLYWAADVYISVSTHEGASVSVMKAMACGLPVLATPVGETSARMKRYGVGRFVPVFNYDEWRVAIEQILEKGRPKPLDREVAREAYHWPRVAKRFIPVYEDLLRGSSKAHTGSHV